MAVYTRISNAETAALLAEYDIGTLTRLEPIEAGVENSNYHLFTSNGHFILTLFEKRVREEDLPFFFAFTDHLAAGGLRCPQAVRGRDGAIITRAAGRPAAIITFLDGHDLKKGEITQNHTAQLGAALARMHLSAESFSGTRENTVGLEYWKYLHSKTSAKADSVSPGLAATIETELNYLSSHWPANLPSGVVHADLFPDNVFFKDGDFFGVIDFYFSCTAPFAYDLAITLNAWCFDDGGVRNRARYDAMLDAYQSVRPLSAQEKSAFPVLCRAAALRFLMTRLYDYIFHDEASFVKPKDPREYLSILRYYQS